MKKRKGLIIGLIIFLVAIIGVAIGAKRLIDQKVANNEKIVATSAAITEIFDKLNVNLAGVPKTQAKLPARYQKDCFFESHSCLCSLNFKRSV